MDSVHDPANWDYWCDEVEATLFNRYGEVCIGDTIYHLLANGDVLAIHYSDCKNIKNIRADPEHWYDYGAILKSASAGSSDVCKKYQTERHWIFKDFYQYDKKFKIRCQSILHTPLSEKSRAKARTISYRQRKNGKYRKSPRSIRAVIHIQAYDYGCDGGIVTA